jgi:hypothetical protein
MHLQCISYNTHTHTHTHKYMYVCIYICNKTNSTIPLFLVKSEQGMLTERDGSVQLQL